MNDAHIIEYYDHLESLDWQYACEDMNRRAGIWEDNGCSSVGTNECYYRSSGEFDECYY